MLTEEILESVVEGKTIRQWLKSDEGLVDYDKCEMGAQVSNNAEWTIYDTGMFCIDRSFGGIKFYNSVDLARLAGVAMGEDGYDEIGVMDTINGYEYATMFFNSIKNVTVQDFVYRFFHLIDGYVYISETCHRVFVKGRRGTKEEIAQFREDYNSRIF